MKTPVAAATLLAQVALLTALGAQRPTPGPRFQLQLGAGAGGAVRSCGSCSGQSVGGPDFAAAIFHSAGPSVWLGLEAYRFQRASEFRLGQVLFVAERRLSRPSGWRWRVGAGLAGHSDVGLDTEVGAGLLIGGAYRASLGPGVALLPTVGIRPAWFPQSDYFSAVLELTLRLSFQ